MALEFTVNIGWTGSGREGEGVVLTGGQRVAYAAPATMGGKGVGTSPEELLLAAVGSCYSATLFRVVERRGLPVERVSVDVRGFVEDYPEAARFARIVVQPTIVGGEAGALDQYGELALRARDLCFIGKAVRGNVAYEVGDVRVTRLQRDEAGAAHA